MPVAVARDTNPFRISGELPPGEMIDREREVERILSLAAGGHSVRIVAPRRYGKTTLLRRALDEASAEGMATALVDLEGVLSLASIVVRIERAYDASLKGTVRRAVDALLRSWDIGLALGGGGFTARLQTTPRLDVETVLLRLLELPDKLHERSGTPSLIAFDEIQDLLRVEGADGAIRSVIQHQVGHASYAFAGSAPSLMRKLFDDPSRPLLEHAVPLELGPLPLDAVGEVVEDRFRASGRDVGAALDPLVETSRGHPQRTMLLAHNLWELVPRGSLADESAWLDALARSLAQAGPVLAARWEGLPLNEQRLAMALALGRGSIYEEAVWRAVGLKRGSIDRALASLEGRGEVIRTGTGPRLTDPLFERWLADRGLL